MGKSKDNGIKYKLTQLWGVMERSGENHFENKDDFLDWAWESGYKPWKSLSMIDETDGYSRDNCIWIIDKKNHGEIKEVDEDDSIQNVCRIIKRIVNNLEESKIDLMMAQQLLRDVSKSKVIDNKAPIRDSIKDVDKALMELRSSLVGIEKIDINFDNK